MRQARALWACLWWGVRVNPNHTRACATGSEPTGSEPDRFRHGRLTAENQTRIGVAHSLLYGLQIHCIMGFGYSAGGPPPVRSQPPVLVQPNTHYLDVLANVLNYWVSHLEELVWLLMARMWWSS
jgi:hypothetical protein